MGNVDTRLWQGRRMRGIKKTSISLVLLRQFCFLNCPSTVSQTIVLTVHLIANEDQMLCIQKSLQCGFLLSGELAP